LHTPYKIAFQASGNPSMHYIEAPQEYSGHGPSLFLAGGISGCVPWQSEVVERLGDLPMTLLNPRRCDFPMHLPDAAAEQIRWEYEHLRRATMRLFWFPPQTMCPIALYELGGATLIDGPLYVGTDAAYQRRRDVMIQLSLARPEVRVVDNLDDLCQQVRDALRQGV
jgi:hypothetical protein